ncbi:MAG: HypC/HybG/HupF family hydrogenase formation chaperone [Acidimicrobiales bacterium]|jgi:hydrogenase maturation factor
MCVSCLGNVLECDGPKRVLVEHVNGLVTRASLLALDGPPPEPGDWVVVHSGYVIDRIDAADGERAAADIRRGERMLAHTFVTGADQ